MGRLPRGAGWRSERREAVRGVARVGANGVLNSPPWMLNPPDSCARCPSSCVVMVSVGA